MVMSQNILTLSPSRKKSFQRCRLKHYIHYLLRKRTAKIEPKFMYGTAIHEALSRFYTHKDSDLYKQINPLEDIIKTFKLHMITEGLEANLSHEIQAMTTQGIAILKDYYQNVAIKDTFQVISTEVSFSLGIQADGIISDRVNSDSFVVFSGKIDMIIKIGELYYIVDHKTTEMDEYDFEYHTITDTQLLDYSIYGRHTYKDNFGGVIFNVLCHLPRSEWMQRFYWKYTDQEIDYAISTYLDVAQEYYTFENMPHQMTKRNEQYDCRYCGDQDASLLYMQGKDWKSYIDTHYEDIQRMDWE